MKGSGIVLKECRHVPASLYLYALNESFIPQYTSPLQLPACQDQYSDERNESRLVISSSCTEWTIWKSSGKVRVVVILCRSVREGLLR